jgi:hypothetical protein
MTLKELLLKHAQKLFVLHLLVDISKYFVGLLV